MLNLRRAFARSRVLAPAAIALSALLLAGASSAAVAAATPVKPVWAQDGSDLTPDPALRFGVLPNGMRYVLMKNDTPPGQASLRLRFDAGSLMERDDQQGLAHFIEHMAFQGSTHVKRGEMIKILERHGLAFGPDTNAFTNWGQTVYQLDLPHTDADTLDTGLFLMRETAGNLTFDADALKNERGVVLSEERMRDGPSMHVGRQQFDYLLKGQLTPKRFPIGDVNVLKTAPRERLLDLYHHYYRPERATLVMVGDFDVDAVEKSIRDKFSDWRPDGPAGAEPVIGPVAPRNQEVRLVVEPGSAANVSLNWVSPPDLDRDSKAERSADYVRALGFAVLNRRFERITRDASPPFIGAGAGRSTVLKTADLVSVSATVDPAKMPEALAAIETEARRAAQYGVTQAELDREITEVRAALKASADGAATRRTPRLADGIAETVDDDSVYTSPADDLALFEDAVKGLTAEQVSTTLKAQFAGAGPLVFAVSPTQPKGGEKALAQAFDQARVAEVTPPTQVAAKSWPYGDFGAAGKVADRKEVLDLDTTFVRFDNGVRLTVKPTKLRRNQVLVAVRVAHGRLDLPRDRVNETWALGKLLPEGGLKQLTAGEMEQVLAGKLYGADFGVGDDAFVLSGGTRPEDFGTQMQVLAAYLKEPGWRPEPWERLKTAGQTWHNQMEASPGGVFGREGAALLRSGDKRWVTPDRQQIAQARLEDLKGLVQNALATGQIEVVVVGDVDVDEAVRQTSLTFGALPARAPGVEPSADARTVRFPKATPQPVRLTHKGRADQGVAFMAWPTPDFVSDPQRAREIRMLQLVMQLRLTEQLRQKEGVTYSPQTGFDAEWDYPGYGYISAAMEAPPARLDGFFADVGQIAKDLREHPISDDELKRALTPRVAQLEREKTTNGYWLGQLSGAQTDPRKLDAIRSAVPGLQRVTAAQIQKAAQTWLDEAKAYRVVVVPDAASTQTAAAAATTAAASKP